MAAINNRFLSLNSTMRNLAKIKQQKEEEAKSKQEAAKNTSQEKTTTSNKTASSQATTSSLNSDLLLTYRGINVHHIETAHTKETVSTSNSGVKGSASKEADLWNKVDDLLQNKGTTQSKTAPVKADSSSSVSGTKGSSSAGTVVGTDNTSSVSGSNGDNSFGALIKSDNFYSSGGIGAVKSNSTFTLDSLKSDPNGTINKLTDEEYKELSLKFSTIDPSEFSNKTSGSTTAFVFYNNNKIYNDIAYKIKDFLQKAVDDLANEVSKQIEQYNFPIDKAFLDFELSKFKSNIFKEVDQNDMCRCVTSSKVYSYEAKHTLDNKKIYQVVADKWISYVRNAAENDGLLLRPTEINIVSDNSASVSSGKLGSYSNLDKLTQDEFETMAKKNYTVSPDSVPSSCAVNTSGRNDNNPTSLKKEYDKVFNKEITNCLKEIIKQIKTQSKNNGFPIDYKFLNNVLCSFTETEYRLLNIKSDLEKVCVKKNYYGGQRTGVNSMVSYEIDNTKLYRLLSSEFNKFMNEKIDRFGLEKPEIKTLEYKFNPKSSLNASEQMTAITLRNTAVMCKEMIDKYGDREVEFNGEKMMLSELTYYYYTASKDTSTIKTLAKQVTEAGSDALAGAGVKADSTSSTSSTKGSSSAGSVVKADNTASVSSSTGNNANKISDISKPHVAMTRSMDDDGGVHWGEDDDPNDDWGRPGWTDDIIITPGSGKEDIDFDPMDEPDMDFKLDLEDRLETIQQNDLWDDYFNSYDSNVNFGATIGSIVGSIEKFSKLGKISNATSCASAVANFVKDGFTPSTIFNGVSTGVGCCGMLGTVTSIVSNAYKDGISWCADLISSFETQMQKCFSTPSWISGFQMGF